MIYSYLLRWIIMTMAYFLKWTQSREKLSVVLAIVLKRLLFKRFRIVRDQIYQSLYFLKNNQEEGFHRLLLAYQGDGDDLSIERLSDFYCDSFFRHFALTCLEMIEFTCYQDQEIADLIEIQGEELIDQALTQKKGLLVLSLHLGNWEMLIKSAIVSKHQFYVISKQMHQDFAQHTLKWMRKNKVVVLYGKNQARQIINALAQNHIVVDVLDQHSNHKHAISADFFGRRCWTSIDFFRIAQMTQSPILCIYQYRKGKKFKIEVKEINGLETKDQMEDRMKVVLKMYENLIISHFDQWLWMHRRWKDRKEIKSNKSYLQS